MSKVQTTSQNVVLPPVDSRTQISLVAQQVRNSWNSGLQGLLSIMVKPPSQLCRAMPVDYLAPLIPPIFSLLHIGTTSEWRKRGELVIDINHLTEKQRKKND